MLTELHNALLPRLISGEIRVERFADLQEGDVS